METETEPIKMETLIKLVSQRLTDEKDGKAFAAMVKCRVKAVGHDTLHGYIMNGASAEDKEEFLHRLLEWTPDEPLPEKPPREPAKTGNDNPFDQIRAGLSEFIRRQSPPADEAQMRAIALDAVGKALEDGFFTRTIEVRVNDQPAVKLEGAVHEKFPVLLKLAQMRLNIFLSGPAGSGKTTAGEQCAKALGLPFYAMSVGPQTSKGDLLGVLMPEGYKPSLLRKAYEFGGVMVVDEIDAAHAGVLTILNAMTSNNICGFPDGMVARHKDFICIVTGNTWGWGANSQYVGRNQLDAATLDRFIRVDWQYDVELEQKLCGNHEWHERVRQLRGAVAKHKAKLVISPRASINGAALLANGFKQDEVERMVIFEGVDEATVNKIRHEN